MPTANPIGLASFSSLTYTYNALLSDGDDINSKSGTVASGTGVLVRGTIVKWDPATGNVTIPAVVADCNGILSNDIDATSATVGCNVYITGSFKADAITWPGALSHALVTDQLRAWSIYIQSVVYTDGTLVRSAPTAIEEAEARKHIEHNKALEAKAEKAAKEAEKEGDKEQPKPADSAWAYLTSDEREQHPEWADPVVADGVKETSGHEGKAEPPVREPHKGEPPHQPPSRK
jgi:hypothetical protein